MKPFTNHLFSLLLLLQALMATAQKTQEDLFRRIPYAQPGKCYAKCFIPDQYETITDQIILKEAHTIYQAQAATYDTIQLTITEKPAYTTLILQAPIFEIQTLQMPVSDTLGQWHYTPPTFETMTEQILTQPANLVWQKQTTATNCSNSSDDKACYIWCLVEKPAQYRTIQRQIVKTPARLTYKQIPPRYITLQKAILKQAARIDTQYIAAQTRQIETLKLQTPATQIAVDIPAEYSSVTRKKLIKAGGFTDYIELICEIVCFRRSVVRIQEALKALGYHVPIDNIVGPSTRAAIIDFQKKNNLPVGNLNIETLRKLGVE